MPYTIEPPPPGAAAPTAGKYTIEPPTAAPSSPPSPPGSAFFGAAQLLPEGAQKYLPSSITGPSVGDQLAGEHERIGAEEKRLGRPLTPRERVDLSPVTGSPVAMGFATHQVGELPGAMAATKSAAAENFIDRSYTRAVKPTVAGKGAASQLERYREQARGAISSIVSNKANLRFEDPGGAVTTGELPKSLEQFGDAIEQTKQEIFKKYDAMAQQAGQAGAAVPLNPAAGELRKIASDQVVQDLHPEVANYANGLADALDARGSYTTTDAQRAVQNLNTSLKAFYKNPTYETASRASIDSLLANKLRAGLDAAIEGAVAPGYQDLKSEYGALKTIESDVVKRAQVEGRKEAGGGILGRIADVASAEEVMRGIFTLNPAAIARGAGLKGWAEYVKYLRDPNRAVSRIFEAAEQQQTPQAPPAPIVPSTPISPVFPAHPMGRQDPGQSAMGLQ